LVILSSTYKTRAKRPKPSMPGRSRKEDHEARVPMYGLGRTVSRRRFERWLEKIYAHQKAHSGFTPSSESSSMYTTSGLSVTVLNPATRCCFERRNRRSHRRVLTSRLRHESLRRSGLDQLLPPSLFANVNYTCVQPTRIQGIDRERSNHAPDGQYCFEFR
jgi:hypothetical protein